MIDRFLFLFPDPPARTADLVPELKPISISVYDLPNDALWEIFSHLDPHSLTQTALVNKNLSTVYLSNFIFKKKLATHYPTIHRHHPISSSFYAIFRDHYKTHSDLTPKERKWFSLIKEGDIDQIQKLNLGHPVRFERKQI